MVDVHGIIVGFVKGTVRCWPNVLLAECDPGLEPVPFQQRHDVIVIQRHVVRATMVVVPILVR